jgi:thioredoxin 1
MIQTTDSGSSITYIIAGLILAYIVYMFIRNRNRMKKPPSENVKILTDGNFNATIKKGVSLVDFWAAWCGPCRVQGPIVDEIADEIGDKANICKLDIDQHKKTAGQLGIQSIPTILIFKDGKMVQKFVGVKSKPTFIKAIKSYI